MKCTACQYEGPAVAIEDSAGKPLYVCPVCQTPKALAPKAWEVLGIPKARYLAARPWKAAKMKRAAFEAILVHVPHEAVDILKRGAEAEFLLSGTTYSADKLTVLCEIVWIDEVLSGQVVGLLEAAADASKVMDD